MVWYLVKRRENFTFIVKLDISERMLSQCEQLIAF
jgi:hypothetical protein